MPAQCCIPLVELLNRAYTSVIATYVEGVGLALIGNLEHVLGLLLPYEVIWLLVFRNICEGVMISQLSKFICSVGHCLKYFDQFLSIVLEETRVNVRLAVLWVIVVEQDGVVSLESGRSAFFGKLAIL